MATVEDLRKEFRKYGCIDRINLLKDVHGEPKGKYFYNIFKI
jgi:hypothetical protein